ncbi:MAG: HAD-IIB family hydrolase [Ruminococcus sp.]|nr:HAD-IIB family hydrolase [Ruminococcus sp.]
MKKVIFFDVDGTLITEDSRSIIPESTRTAIAKARANGNLTFINTGRTAFNLSDEIKGLGFDGYLCGCGTYIEYNGEVLMYNRLEQGYCRKIAGILRSCGAVPVYEHRDCLFFDKKAPSTPDLKYFKEVFLDNDVRVDFDVSDDNFGFDKFVFWKTENTDFEMLKKQIEPDFMMIDRGGGFYENVPKDFTKATAIDFILERLGIPLENAYAIGDSMNDLPMLTAVPNSIAMGGAEKIYLYVSFITKPIEDDGIEFALRHFGII